MTLDGFLQGAGIGAIVGLVVPLLMYGLIGLWDRWRGR